MLILYELDKKFHEIVMEGTAFYFSSMLPVAFRQKGKLFFRKEQFGHKTNGFLTNLLLGVPQQSAIALEPDVFRKKIESAYQKALFRGMQKVTLFKMGIEKSGDTKNVDHE